MLANQPPKKLYTLLTLGLLFAGALVLGPNLITPDVDAIESEDCYCDLGQRTQDRWGIGSSCAASLANLDAQASADYQNDAPTVCDPVCGFGPGEGCEPRLVITGSCTYNSSYGQFITDGHYAYGCFTCP